eukprot:2677919-Prymnesium_polylepis.2
MAVLGAAAAEMRARGSSVVEATAARTGKAVCAEAAAEVSVEAEVEAAWRAAVRAALVERAERHAGHSQSSRSRGRNPSTGRPCRRHRTRHQMRTSSCFRRFPPGNAAVAAAVEQKATVAAVVVVKLVAAAMVAEDADSSRPQRRCFPGTPNAHRAQQMCATDTAIPLHARQGVCYGRCFRARTCLARSRPLPGRCRAARPRSAADIGSRPAP